MRLVTFEHRGRTAPGLLRGEGVVDLSRGGRFSDLGALLAGPGLAVAEGPEIPRSEVRLLPPVPRPPKLVAVGLNYRSHAREQGLEPPEVPLFFAKARTCVIGPGDPILLPPGRRYIDAEVELAVVIGRPGFRLSAEQAMDWVLGFTIFNDVSDRKAQKDDGQWYRAKSLPTFGPMGPVVVTPDEFNWQCARITLELNGSVQQDSTTADLVHPVPRLLEFLSRFQELEPGDVLATGTPAGVGVFRRPPVYLQEGDQVTCRIEGIGVLTNPVRREEG